MAKPTVFIGSSVEHRNLAFYIQTSLQFDASPVVWTQGTFDPSHFTLESLEEALDKADFAVLVCAPDDIITIRGEAFHSVRDNVIFELGLFIGRLGRKRTFLISPRGVDLHLPSDLNGLTPETFDPNQLSNPEAALGPACTKIRAAILKTGVLPRPDALDVQESGSDDKVEDPPVSQPKPSSAWTSEEFEMQMFLATIGKDEDRAAEIDATYRTSPSASSAETLAEWDAWREVIKMWAGEKGSVKLVREKVDAYPKNPRIRHSLARALAHYGDEAGATKEYMQAAATSADVRQAARSALGVVGLAKDLGDADTPKALKELLLNLPASTHADKLALFEALRAISEAVNLHAVSSALGELIASSNPDDVHARFNLARAYSDADQEGLAMLHYEAIPREERGGSAWNNLGVSYDRLGLRGMAVEAYEISASKEETIADGNLAHKLVRAGFFDEARKRVEAAALRSNPHENVLGATAAIREAREEEVTRYSGIRAKAQVQRRAWAAIGEAARVSVGPEVDGYWDTEFGQVKFGSDEVGIYSASKQISREVKPLGLGFGPTVRRERSLVTITLTRFGNAFEGTIRHEQAEPPLTILGSANFERRVLLSVSQDGTTIEGFQIGEETLIQWKRSPPLAIADQSGAPS